MELDLAVTPEVVSWIVGWGPMVGVGSPRCLRDAVVNEHTRALQVLWTLDRAATTRRTR